MGRWGFKASGNLGWLPGAAGTSQAWKRKDENKKKITDENPGHHNKPHGHNKNMAAAPDSFFLNLLLPLALQFCFTFPQKFHASCHSFSISVSFPRGSPVRFQSLSSLAEYCATRPATCLRDLCVARVIYILLPSYCLRHDGLLGRPAVAIGFFALLLISSGRNITSQT